VADLRSPNRLSALFVQAAQQAGLAAEPDFNGPTQEGVGMYQVTQKERRALQRRQGLSDAEPGPPQPAGADRRAGHARALRRPARRGVEIQQGGARRELRRGARCC
jgi:hypothetical protein